MVKFSVVVPVHNEQGNIIPLYREIKEAMSKLGTWEMIFVNDGSRDNSLKDLLSIKEPNVHVINLKTNYGQAVALDAGLRHSKGEFVVTLDGDGQNDPKDISRLYNKLIAENLDVVAGWRKKRKDPMWMHFITLWARILRGFLAKDKVHDSGCTLRVYRHEIIEDLELSGEMHRYIIAILGWKGAKVGELKVSHRARIRGKTNYTWKKSLKGTVDLIYIWFWKKYSGRPLHLFGVLGLFITFLGFLSAIWTAYLKIVVGTSLSNSVWFVMSGFLILGGMLLFLFGIMFDLLIRTYYNTSAVEKRYTVLHTYTAGKKSQR
ncbi:MAG TPA: glycosyltransferase [Candidatus Woesearchaeota archaeon]|nr:glycosyltransferase [Candidatus Woesearchaeota archaeon]